MSKTNKQIHGMVDVSDKDITKRTAVASACINMSAEAFRILIEEGSPKGDIFETAKIAGIQAAKSTSTIIPMCHPLALNKVKIAFERNQTASTITAVAEVVCRGRTGVEMEALTAASVSVLTIYDMMKWAGKSMMIQEVKLLKKTGGKSGDYGV